MRSPGDEDGGDTGRGSDDSRSRPDDSDPLEEVLGDETLTGPDDAYPEASEDDSTERRGRRDDGTRSRDDHTAPPTDSTSATQPTGDREREQTPPQGTPRTGSQGRSQRSASRGQRDAGATASDVQSRLVSLAQPSPALKLFTRDVVTSVLAVVLLGMYLFAISGVWPPMVAIESGSMEPNMEVNDLVFLMETERFQPESAQAGTGVVTAAAGSESGHGSYGDDGDVIVFTPDGNERTTPIIHRAMFWVEEGENWCERANDDYLGSLEPDDEDCVASNAGFITKGDNNNRYDQASLQADNPVKPEWIVGTAEARIPGLGWFRLRFQ